MPVLVVEKGNDKGKSVPIEKGQTIVLGREVGCDFVVDDTLISRRHCQVVADEDGECAVEDLQSMNGTFLNGKRVSARTPVAFGDTIGLGLTRITLAEGEKQKKKGALSGKTVLGYEIGERIGRGGMGTVYRATQMSLSREVALKFLSPELNKDEAFVKKFVQEARSAGALNHPNIIQVYDVAEYKGLHFFSMEYASRGSVEERLGETERLPIAECVRIILDAARGLEYAHRKGIIHRDIKPDNLMVSDDGTVKIGDMGLALNTQSAEIEDTIGNFGTPHFASPEQIKGETVDVRSDLYSLGATFYRIAAGRTPFVGKNVREIMLKQVKEPPPPIAEFVPDVPPAVAAMIHRLLAKDPAERYATPAEVIEALERFQVDLQQAAAPAAPRPLLPANLAPLATAVAVILVSLAGLWLVGRLIPDGEDPSGGDGASGDDGTVVAETPSRREQALAAFQAAKAEFDRDPANVAAIDRLAEVADRFGDTPAGEEAGRVVREAREAIARTRDAAARSGFERAAAERYDPPGSAIPSARALADLEAISRDYPETEWAGKATALAAELRADLERYRSLEPAATADWNKVDTKILEAVNRSSFGDALRAISEFAERYDHPAFRLRSEQKAREVRELARQRFVAVESRVKTHVASDEYDEASAELEEVRLTYGLEEYVTKATTLLSVIEKAKRDWETRTAADRLRQDRQRFDALWEEIRPMLLKLQADRAQSRLRAEREKFQTDEYLRWHDFLEAHVSIVRAYLEEFARRARTGGLARKEATLPAPMVATLLGTFGKRVDRGEIAGLNKTTGEVSFKVDVGRGSIDLSHALSDLPPEQAYEILVGPPRWELSVDEQLGALAIAFTLRLPDRMAQWDKALGGLLMSLTGDDVEERKRRLETYRAFGQR